MQFLARGFSAALSSDAEGLADPQDPAWLTCSYVSRPKIEGIRNRVAIMLLTLPNTRQERYGTWLYDLRK